MPPVGSGNRRREHDQDPNDDARQPGTADASRSGCRVVGATLDQNVWRRDRPHGDARARERAVEVLGRGRAGRARGLVL